VALIEVKHEIPDLEMNDMEVDPPESTPVCTTEDSSVCSQLPKIGKIPDVFERETPVQSDRRRKQDLSEVVAELPQESDNESIATVSANESYTSDVTLL
jgi:hypothetical protein